MHFHVIIMLIVQTRKEAITANAAVGMTQCVKGCGPRKGRAPPEGGRGDAPDHFLRSGLLQLLSSQSPRLARGSLR